MTNIRPSEDLDKDPLQDNSDGSDSNPETEETTTSVRSSGRARRKSAKYKGMKYGYDQEFSDEDSESDIPKKLVMPVMVDAAQKEQKPRIDYFVGRRINEDSGMVEYRAKFEDISNSHLVWLAYSEALEFMGDGYRERMRIQAYERKLKREGYAEIEEVDDVNVSSITVDCIFSHKKARLPTMSEMIEPYRANMVQHVYPTVTSAFLFERREAVLYRIHGLVKKLISEPDADPFRQPVDIEEVPNYFDYIETAMDLGTIDHRMTRGEYYIGAGADEMAAADIRLVFQNCQRYNEDTSAIYKVSKDLSQMFERLYVDWILTPSAWVSGLEEWKPFEAGCSICEMDGQEHGEMILCDRCDGEYHLYCLDPPLEEVPEDDWFCSFCVARKDFESTQKANTSKGSSGGRGKKSTQMEFPKFSSPYKAILTARPPSSIDENNKDAKARNFETVYLVKWLGLSYRFSTWETEDDIDNHEKIQRYHRYNKMPTAMEIKQTVCQMPCCAYEMTYSMGAGRNSCQKDKFCTLGYFHSGTCSRELASAETGSREFVRQRMVDQIRAQLYAYYQIMNNQELSPSLMKDCGLYTTAKTLREEHFPKVVKNYDEYDDKEEENDDSSSEEEDDDDEDGGMILGDEVVNTMMFPGEKAPLYVPVRADEQTKKEDNEEEIHDEVSNLMGAMVEHIAFSKKLPSLTPVRRPKVMYCEYNAVIRKGMYGLGMRLGLTDDGMVRVVGFQRTPMGDVGPAEATNLIHVGDYLVMVNQRSVIGMAFNSLIELIAKSPGFVMIRFRTDRNAQSFPKFCDARNKHAELEEAPNNPYIPFPFCGDDEDNPNVLVGNNEDAVDLQKLKGPAMMRRLQNFMPSGPMQHLYAAVCDNSVNILEHFRAFLPLRMCEELDRNQKLKEAAAENDEEEDGVDPDEFVPYEKSPTYKGSRSLRQYQVDGLNWMISCYKARRSCILADEMGLGKTVQVVSFVEHLRTEENIRGPYLIIVPLSTIQHWRREIEDWTDMNVCVYHDAGDTKSRCSAKEMRTFIRQMQWHYPQSRQKGLFKFNVLLTTYETIITDFDEFENIHWRLIVFDEAHRLKSGNSKVLKRVKTLRVDRRLLLTGTPLQNNIQELWVLLNYLEPTKFDNYEEFNLKFGKLKSQEQVVELQKQIQPYILRRIKEDVEKSIPPKEETIIEVELTTMQKRYYRAIYEKNRSYLYKGLSGSLPSLHNIQMQLRKCCNHPFLIEGVREREIEEELGEDASSEEIMNLTIQAGGKFVLVSKLLPKLKREGHKVLIFSQFLKQLDFLEQYCETMGFRCERLDGSVHGHERQNAIDRFSKPNSKSFIFLLSTRAGGVGINLIAADTVIIFDSDWNPQNDLQAQSRCHRIGQEKAVKIYRLITRNSFESEMFARASRKLGLEHAVLGTASFHEADLGDRPSAEVLEELLKRGAYGLADDDDSAFRKFAERDIEDILKENAHVHDLNATSDKTKSVGGMTVDRSSFVAERADNQIDVDDPNFWEKVLTGDMTVEMLGLKLEDGSAIDSKQSKAKYLKNLKSATERILKEMQSGDDKEKDSNHVREYDMALQLWQKTMTMKKEFTTKELKLAEEMMDILHKSRVRSCRVQSLPPPPQKRKRRKSLKSKGGSTPSTPTKRKSDGDKPALQTDEICSLCGDGGLILLCDGPCHRSFHLECVGITTEPEDDTWFCPDCVAGRHICLKCNKIGEAGVEGGVMQCSEGKCGRFYHRACLRHDEHVRWVGRKRFKCPQHFCSVCDGVEGTRSKVLLKCMRSPAAFHEGCIEEGTYLRLSKTNIICKGTDTDSGSIKPRFKLAQAAENGDMHEKEEVEKEESPADRSKAKSKKRKTNEEESAMDVVDDVETKRAKTSDTSDASVSERVPDSVGQISPPDKSLNGILNGNDVKHIVSPLQDNPDVSKKRRLDAAEESGEDNVLFFMEPSAESAEDEDVPVADEDEQPVSKRVRVTLRMSKAPEADSA